MKLIAAVLFVALMGAGLASGDEAKTDPEIAKGEKVCNKAETLCILNKSDLDALVNEVRIQFTTAQILQVAASKQAEQIEYLKAELAKVQAIKGCAKVEVLPRGGKN